MANIWEATKQIESSISATPSQQQTFHRAWNKHLENVRLVKTWKSRSAIGKSAKVTFSNMFIKHVHHNKNISVSTKQTFEARARKHPHVLEVPRSISQMALLFHSHQQRFYWASKKHWHAWKTFQTADPKVVWSHSQMALIFHRLQWGSFNIDQPHPCPLFLTYPPPPAQPLVHITS